VSGIREASDSMMCRRSMISCGDSEGWRGMVFPKPLSFLTLKSLRG
jgi:hypothetical protein